MGSYFVKHNNNMSDTFTINLKDIYIKSKTSYKQNKNSSIYESNINNKASARFSRHCIGYGGLYVYNKANKYQVNRIYDSQSSILSNDFINKSNYSIKHKLLQDTKVNLNKLLYKNNFILQNSTYNLKYKNNNLTTNNNNNKIVIKCFNKSISNKKSSIIDTSENINEIPFNIKYTESRNTNNILTNNNSTLNITEKMNCKLLSDNFKSKQQEIYLLNNNALTRK